MKQLSDWVRALEILDRYIKPVFDWVKNKSPIVVIWKASLPRLGLIESSWRGHKWNYQIINGKKAIMLDTNWHIANTLRYNLTSMNAFLVKPEYVKGSIMLKDVNSQYWGHYTIPKGYTTDMSITFPVDKKFAKNSSSVIKAKIDLQDPTGRVHHINSVNIYPLNINKPEPREVLKIEDTSKIKDETERKVVAVLKNEIKQYAVRGRREGRLGTVEWPHGTIEWRDADSKISYLYGNSEKINVRSEYVDAILSLFRKSGTKDKHKIVKALLDRIDKKTEYRDVSYLIVFCLIELGHLKEALEIALRRLKGDGLHGFSDVLRLVDILLGFRYEEFDEEDLDSIEEFIFKAGSEVFSVKERINAIRVNRMSS